MRTPPKDPSETKQLRFDFSTELGSTETIASATCEVTLLKGTDPDPSEILESLPVINNTTQEVWQVVQGGAIGAEYEIRCLAVGNTGLRHLIVAILPIRDEEGIL